MYLFSGGPHQCVNVEIELHGIPCWRLSFNFFFFHRVGWDVCAEWPSGIHVIMMLIPSFTLYPGCSFCSNWFACGVTNKLGYDIYVPQYHASSTQRHTETWQMTIIFCLLGGVSIKHLCMNCIYVWSGERRFLSCSRLNMQSHFFAAVGVVVATISNRGDISDSVYLHYYANNGLIATDWRYFFFSSAFP